MVSTLEELTHRLADSTTYSKIDAKNQIIFYRTIFSAEGRKSDPDKIKGITEMPPCRYAITTFLSRC